MNKIVFRQKIIFDFDDAIFLPIPFKTKILTRLADHVTVGSHYLYDWAKKYNKNVTLVPTVVRYDIYKNFPASYSGKDKVVIGWVGHGPAHLLNLKIISSVLRTLLKNRLRIHFTLIGTFGSVELEDHFREIDGLTTTLVEYIPQSEMPQTIQAFDIGVMPLQDKEWSKGKCSLKALEYMACGVATVVSAVGENNFVIEDGINGFLAEDENEWVQKMTRLIKDVALRKQLGESGRSTIKDRYSFEVVIPEIINVIKN